MNKHKKSEQKLAVKWTHYPRKPITSCQHGCAWEMPDGSCAEYYARTIADRFRSPAFMFANPLDHEQQMRMVLRRLNVRVAKPDTVTWMSRELLSFDNEYVLEDFPEARR